MPVTNDVSLEALMEALLDGDARAFETLYARLAPRVRGLFRALGADARAAEDLTQTTFLKVHRARESYRRGAPVEPWVFAIARRSLIDSRRRTKRRPEFLSEDGSMPEPAQDTAASDGFDRLDEAQLKALQKGMDALPAAQREALVLLKVEGLSISEAAAVAGTTSGALKVRAHRAYEALRRALGVPIAAERGTRGGSS